MGRLTREDNAYANKTYVYEYITNGNIASKKTYAYTTGTLGTVQTTETRAYGNSNWLDQLTNINATAITYDSMGNPLNWHNASAFTWEGRKLKSLTKTDGTVISYAYDENGIRTGKTDGSENVSYVLDGTKIVREIRSAYTLTFLYDDSGVLIGFNYNNGTTSADYYYGIDNWGNINYIYDSTGAVVVTYKYDAWGNAISTTGTLAGTIGAINPYRYKSYYYDAETGLYYLQSRYYDAQVQRFVSPDMPELLGTSSGIYAYNLYAYCENDPVNLFDSVGYFSIPRGVVSFAIDAIIWAIFSTGAATFAALTQPIKTMARSAGQALIKAKMLGILKGFSKTLAGAFTAIAKVIVPVIKKSVGWLFRKWAAKQTIELWAGKMAGGLVSLTANKFLNVLANNVTIFLSIGGLVGGLLDYFTDKELNGRIKLW